MFFAATGLASVQAQHLVSAGPFLALHAEHRHSPALSLNMSARDGVAEDVSSLPLVLVVLTLVVPPESVWNAGTRAAAATVRGGYLAARSARVVVVHGESDAMWGGNFTPSHEISGFSVK